MRTEFEGISVGNLVRGSVDENSSLVPYDFEVLEVVEEELLVLDNWGTFLLEEKTPEETRLIVRTRERKSSGLLSKATSYLMVALHYLMERRTLMGIKERTEFGEGIPFSSVKDILWFLGIVLSGILICVFIFTGVFFAGWIVLPMMLGTLWLFSLFLFKPIPIYSMGLAVIALAVLIFLPLK